MTVEYLHGDGVPIPHTPSGAAVAAGAVVVVGDECRIAHLDIADGELGSLFVPSGNCEYQAPKSTGVGHAIADGADVYWDASEGKVTYTDDTGANQKIGECTAAAGDDDTTCRFRHSKGN